MTKHDFKKIIILSSFLTVIAIAIIIGFCMLMFDTYSMPNEDNTSVISSRVTEVYHRSHGRRIEVVAVLSNGDSLELVYPGRQVRTLYSTVGYNITQLADLLEGKNVECLRMNRVPWAIKIYVDDIVIDNEKLTEDTIIKARTGIVIIGLIMLAFAIGGDVLYLKAKYKCYAKAERKRIRKIKRDMKKTQYR